MLILGIVALVAGALLGVYGLVQLRQTRELLAPTTRRRPPVVLLELEPVYPNGANGALVRLSLHELEHRATTTDEDERLLWPSTFDVPAHGAHAVRVRVYEADADLAAIYAGATTTVDRESEPPPAFLGGRS